MEKVRHDKNLRIMHEGMVWNIDAAEWIDTKDRTKGELRVYKVYGNINSPHLVDALMLEAASRGLGIKLV